LIQKGLRHPAKGGAGLFLVKLVATLCNMREKDGLVMILLASTAAFICLFSL
jgi:hypothetical protein